MDIVPFYFLKSDYKAIVKSRDILVNKNNPRWQFQAILGNWHWKIFYLSYNNDRLDREACLQSYQLKRLEGSTRQTFLMVWQCEISCSYRCTGAFATTLQWAPKMLFLSGYLPVKPVVTEQLSVLFKPYFNWGNGNSGLGKYLILW